MMRFLTFFLTFLLLVSSVSAQTFINIYVDETGTASFFGETSQDSLSLPNGISLKEGKILGKTQDLTSKNGTEWSFSYFLNNSEFNVILPEGTTLKSLSDSEVSSEEDRISLYSEKEIFISYTITPKSKSPSTEIIISIISIFLLLGMYYLILRSKKNNSNLKILNSVLSEREKLIINTLKKHKKIKSSYLRKSINMPKASFSRHILNLEKKKLIKRSGEGKNKFLEIVDKI